MAVYDNNTQYQAGVMASLISRAALNAVNAFVNVRNAVVEWNLARETRRALAKLPNSTLEDIGLCRGDIAMVARKR